MLQYKIPQNVGIEDKIVGPFSLRQLIILAIGGGISYTLFAITSRIYEMNIIEYIFIALPALLALAIAMIRIHNVSFGKYILLLIEFAIKPKKRIWDHRGISALVAPDLTEKSADANKETISEKKSRKNVNLGDLSAMLDSGGFEHIEQVKHEDIDQVTDDDLITEAYFGHKKKDSSTENMYWRTRDVQKKKLNLLAKLKPSPPPAPTPAPALAPALALAPAPAPAPEPEKKESVTEHLANIIKEARQNNQKKKEAIIPPAPAKIDAAANVTSSESPKKKRRKRKRKPKPETQPVRQETQINTTSKSEPVQIIQKYDKNEGETSFSDLSEGGEIEINLD